MLSATPDLCPEQGLGHDTVGVEQQRRALVFAEGSAAGVEEFVYGEAEHLLCSLEVALRRRDAIALQKSERGPRIGIDLTLTVSSTGSVLGEVEGPLFADQIGAYELERPEGNVTEVLSPGGLAERQQGDRRLRVPRGHLVAVHRRLARSPSLGGRQPVVRGIGALAAVEAPRGRVVEIPEQVRRRTLRGFPVARVPGHAVSFAEHRR